MKFLRIFVSFIYLSIYLSIYLINWYPHNTKVFIFVKKKKKKNAHGSCKIWISIFVFPNQNFRLRPGFLKKILGDNIWFSSALSYRNCVITLVGGWWGQGIARAFTRCMMKEKLYKKKEVPRSCKIWISIFVFPNQSEFSFETPPLKKKKILTNNIWFFSQNLKNQNPK